MKGDVVKRAIQSVHRPLPRVQRERLRDGEINPLVETGDGQVHPLDCKLNFDSNALYPTPRHRRLPRHHEEDPSEVEASKHRLGVHQARRKHRLPWSTARGLAMATMDIIKLSGGEPAISWTSAAVRIKKR